VQLARRRRHARADSSGNQSKGQGYPACTNAIYREVLGASALELRKRRGFPTKANIRNSLDLLELSGVIASEALATDRIEDENRRGDGECLEASRRSAGFIREAFERDRADRNRKRLV
jgi:hypothetical protein